MNLEITAENIAAVNSYFKTQAQFERTINKIKMQLGIELMPVLGDLAKGLRDALLGPDGKLLSSVRSSIDSLVVAFNTFGSVVVKWAPLIVDSIGKIASAISTVLDLYSRLESMPGFNIAKFGLETVSTGGMNIVGSVYRRLTGTGQKTPGMWGQIAGAVPSMDLGQGGGKSFAGMMQTWWDGAGALDKFKASAGGAKQAVQELQDVTVPAFSTMAQSFSPLLGYMAQIVTKMYEAKKAADEALAMQTAQNYMVANGIDWGAIEAVPYDRKFPEIQNPDTTLGGIDFTLYSEESMDLVREQVSYLLDIAFPGLGSGMEYMRDAMTELANTSESELQRVLMTTETFASAYLAAAETIGAAAGQIFGAGLSGGWKGLIAQAVTMIAQYFGKKLTIMGAGMIAEGSAEVIMGMNPLAPNPALVAHGAAMMKTGGVITAVGAALTAAAPAIGSAVGGLVGGNGSSSGSKSGSSSTSSYTSAAETATGYTYTVGGGTGGATGGAQGRQAVTININAMDSQSFHDYLQKNGSEAVTSIMERSYRSNGSARTMRTWG